MRTAFLYFLQMLVVAVASYGAWYLVAGKPDIAFAVWALIFLLAGLLGLIPYVIQALIKRRRGKA